MAHCLGSLQIHIQRTKLDACGGISSGFVHAEIYIRGTPMYNKSEEEGRVGGENEELVVHRQTNVCSDILTPLWRDADGEDVFELRCCLDWVVSICVVVRDADQSRGARESVRLRVEEELTVAELCRRGAGQSVLLSLCIEMQSEDAAPRQRKGIVQCDFVYFPNHQSLRCLLLDSCTEGGHSREGVPAQSALPNMLLSQLNVMVMEKVMELTSSADTEAEEGSSLEHFKSVLHFLQTLGTFMYPPRSQEQGHTMGQGRDGILYHLQTYTHMYQASDEREGTLGRSECVSAMQDFLNNELLTHLVKGLAPAASAALLNRQFDIFCQCTCADTRVVVVDAAFAQFVRALCIWFAQQSFLTASLLLEYNSGSGGDNEEGGLELGIVELDGLRARFQQLDTHLAGEINSNKLGSLLTSVYGGDEVDGDEGGAPIVSDASVQRLAQALDCFDVRVVEFTEFVHWWCTGQQLEEKEEEEEEEEQEEQEHAETVMDDTGANVGLPSLVIEEAQRFEFSVDYDDSVRYRREQEQLRAGSGGGSGSAYSTREVGSPSASLSSSQATGNSDGGWTGGRFSQPLSARDAPALGSLPPLRGSPKHLAPLGGSHAVAAGVVPPVYTNPYGESKPTHSPPKYSTVQSTAAEQGGARSDNASSGSCSNSDRSDGDSSVGDSSNSDRTDGDRGDGDSSNSDEGDAPSYTPVNAQTRVDDLDGGKTTAVNAGTQLRQTCSSEEDAGELDHDWAWDGNGHGTGAAIGSEDPDATVPVEVAGVGGEDEDYPEWTVCYDEAGYAYYYNNYTGVSQYEEPLQSGEVGGYNYWEESGGKYVVEPNAAPESAEYTGGEEPEPCSIEETGGDEAHDYDYTNQQYLEYDRGAAGGVSGEYTEEDAAADLAVAALYGAGDGTNEWSSNSSPGAAPRWVEDAVTSPEEKHRTKSYNMRKG